MKYLEQIYTDTLLHIILLSLSIQENSENHIWMKLQENPANNFVKN